MSDKIFDMPRQYKLSSDIFLIKEPKQALLRFKILISRCENCRRTDFLRRKYDVFEKLTLDKFKVQKH